MNEWQENLRRYREIRLQLEAELRGLAEVGEPTITAAIHAADPMSELTRLALADTLRPILQQAIRRIDALERDCRGQLALLQKREDRRKNRSAAVMS